MSIFKSDEADATSLVRKVQDGETLLASLNIQASTLAQQLKDVETKVAAAALAAETGGGSKEYEKLVAEAERLKRELTMKNFAADAASRQLSTDRQALFAATTANREKDASKLGNQRSKAVADIVAGLKQAHDARMKLHEVNQKIGKVFGASITTRHTGTLLSSDEVQRALEIEIARISSPVPLDGSACPALPGAKKYIFGGNPASAEPLVSLIEQANAELVKRVAAGLGATDEKPKANAAPAPADPDDKLLQQTTSPAAPTVNAAQVMPARQALKI